MKKKDDPFDKLRMGGLFVGQDLDDWYDVIYQSHCKVRTMKGMMRAVHYGEILREDVIRR